MDKYLHTIVAHPFLALAREFKWDDRQLSVARQLIDITVIRLDTRSSITALRELREAALDVFGDPEDCDDCSELGDTPCRIHGVNPMSQRLLKAIENAEDVLGQCECGHERDEHEPEDHRACRKCACRNFRLPPAVLPPAEPPRAQEPPKPLWTRDRISHAFRQLTNAHASFDLDALEVLHVALRELSSPENAPTGYAEGWNAAAKALRQSSAGSASHNESTVRELVARLALKQVCVWADTYINELSARALTDLYEIIGHPERR